MPTYDYRCSACGHQFEELQTFSEPPLTKCPECKKKKLERLFGGGGAIIFKGSGFYETDYRRAGQPADKGETAPAESKGESGTETKSDAKPADTPKPADAPKPKSEPKPGGGKKKDK